MRSFIFSLIEQMRFLEFAREKNDIFIQFKKVYLIKTQKV